MNFTVSRLAMPSRIAGVLIGALLEIHGGGAAQAEVPDSLKAPRFRQDKDAACVQRARERIRSVMAGTAGTLFDRNPPAKNRSCEGRG